jgi:hypothetical protein
MTTGAKKMTVAGKKLSFFEEVVFIGKVTASAVTLLTLLGALIWQMYARDLVVTETKFLIKEHEAIYCPKISKNTADIATLKDTQMLTYLSLKKLLTEKQSKDAEKEFAEIKKRQ